MNEFSWDNLNSLPIGPYRFQCLIKTFYGNKLDSVDLHSNNIISSPLATQDPPRTGDKMLMSIE